MKKEFIYKICILILFALNLIQVGGFLLTSSRPPRFENRESMDRRMPDKRNFMEETARMLDLNNEQKIKFSEFAKAHDMQIRTLQKKQKELISSYFYQSSDSVLDLIKNIEAQKIEFTQTHMDKVKSILNKDQYQNFEKFKKNALNIILR